MELPVFNALHLHVYQHHKTECSYIHKNVQYLWVRGFAIVLLFWFDRCSVQMKSVMPGVHNEEAMFCASSYSSVPEYYFKFPFQIFNFDHLMIMVVLDNLSNALILCRGLYIIYPQRQLYPRCNILLYQLLLLFFF